MKYTWAEQIEEGNKTLQAQHTHWIVGHIMSANMVNSGSETYTISITKSEHEHRWSTSSLS
jgi:hypothetical protein